MSFLLISVRGVMLYIVVIIQIRFSFLFVDVFDCFLGYKSGLVMLMIDISLALLCLFLQKGCHLLRFPTLVGEDLVIAASFWWTEVCGVEVRLVSLVRLHTCSTK